MLGNVNQGTSVFGTIVLGNIVLSNIVLADIVLGNMVLGNTSVAVKGALAHRLQWRKIQNGRKGAPKWPTGSGKVSTPRFLGVLSNFR